MKKEIIKEIQDLTILIAIAREEGSEDEHKRVVKRILEIIQNLLDRQIKDIFKMIKFNKGDLPAFPPLKLAQDLATPKGLLDWALMVIRLKISKKIK